MLLFYENTSFTKLYFIAEDPFHGYYSFNDQDIEDYLQLGPVELKLLSLSGEPKPLHGKGKNC